MTTTHEQVKAECGYPGCGKPIVFEIDGWMHTFALDQWLGADPHAAIPKEHPMTHPNDETTVLTPVGEGIVERDEEQDPHDWLAGDDDIDNDHEGDPLPDEPEGEDEHGHPMLSPEQQENVAAFQEAARVLRLTALEGVTVTIENVLEVARFIKGTKQIS